MDTEQLFAEMNQLRVAVIGDVMLDTYYWGRVDRISPEAPVPVIALSKKEKRIGGAGNVALNAKMLGAATDVITVLGNDEDAIQVKYLLQKNGISHTHSFTSSRRITTNKTRIISRNQQMLRVDSEMIDDLLPEDEERLLSVVEEYMKEQCPDVVIMEDYNKGVFTERVISETIRLCRNAGAVITVDPKRKNFFAYKGATIFKPNLSEAVTALNLLPTEVTDEMLSDIHEQISAKLDHAISLITLSADGIFYQADGSGRRIPAQKREIADVSGAGDTVIAVASLAYAVSKDVELSVRIANIAGGLVCEEVGTVPVSKQRLMSEVFRLPVADRSAQKI